MAKQIKSGKEVLDDFFAEIKNENGLDHETISAILELYNNGKLTDKNLTNALSELREDNKNGKNK